MVLFIEWALKQFLVCIPGNILRDWKDKKKSHPFIQPSRYNQLHAYSPVSNEGLDVGWEHLTNALLILHPSSHGNGLYTKDE